MQRLVNGHDLVQGLALLALEFGPEQGLLTADQQLDKPS